MKKIMLVFVIGVFLSCSTGNYDMNNIDVSEIPTDTLIISRVALEEGRSKAFTDMTFFDNQYFLVFRDSDKHAFGEDGVIHMFSSPNGLDWTFLKEISVPGIDLRDPSFSINGEELSLYIHGSKYENQTIIEFSDYNLKYSASDGWLEMTDVLLDNLTITTNNISGNEAWPWRVTWYNDVAYTIGYNGSDIFDLYKSDDGVFFTRQNVFENIPFLPSEARIRVDSNGEFFTLVRRINGSTLIGRSFNPSQEWEWFGEISFENFRGPNFLLTNENKMIFSGAFFSWVYLGAYDIDLKTYSQLLEIPSFGDGSYPGMIIQDNILWLSYYTSYENIVGSSIYVAKINLDYLQI